MQSFLLLAISYLASVTEAYYAIVAYAPSHPEIHDEIIHANNKSFVIGAKNPSTFCDLQDKDKCPDGSMTLIDEEMTHLAAAVPGGQFIYVAPDGSISYPSAHSALRPPGSQMGGFFPFKVESNCQATSTVLSWRSKDGHAGLWGCPVDSHDEQQPKAILKASAKEFDGEGCFAIDGVQIKDAGGRYGAWAYT